MTRQQRQARKPKPAMRVARLDGGELTMVAHDVVPGDPWIVRGKVRRVEKIMPGTSHESGATPCLQDQLPLDWEPSGEQPPTRERNRT